MDKLVEEREGGFFYVEWVGEPCPWCGCAGVSGKSPEGHFFAGCPDADCLAHNLAYDFVTVDHARSAWNARAAIAQKRVNELEALVEQMGGGCDANCGGLHSAMQQGREWFCPDCGLMLKRVAYVLPHVKPAVARAALPTMLKGNGDG